jgi:hypothetical protein
MSFISSLLSASNAGGSGNNPPKVYLQNEGNRIQFPVPPPSFEVVTKQNNSTININNIGELNMIGKAGLATITFASFFPAQPYTFCSCTPDEPYNYVKTIDGWKTSKKPCRFIISDTPIDYAVTIEGFKWGERDGTGDVYFSLDFKEYKFVGSAKDTTQFNVLSGMKSRPRSFMESAAQNLTVYPSDSVGDVLGRSIGATASMGGNDKNILAAYKSMSKSGGFKPGDVISYENGSVKKVNGKNVQL